MLLITPGTKRGGQEMENSLGAAAETTHAMVNRFGIFLGQNPTVESVLDSSSVSVGKPASTFCLLHYLLEVQQQTGRGGTY